jgi:DNA primase
MTAGTNKDTANRDEIESVRARNPIDQVIGSYIELKRAGRYLRGLCPFHADNATPSLVVYTNNQTWHCFGCSAGGDVFKFVMKIESIPFKEALARLGGGTLQPRHVPPPPAATDAAPALRELGEEYFTLLTAATEVYHTALLQQAELLAYLAKRGFDLDAVRKYRLGYAAGDNLERYFRFRGWNEEAGLELGLLVKKDDGSIREYFSQRIVIPELRGGPDGSARAVYLVGRATQEWQKAKYLGIAGAPKPLYGSELARDAHEVFVCEGPFDWLTLIQWGYAAVATLGHPKREHAQELARARRIYIATDADDAGRQFAATLKETFGDRAIVLPSFKRFKELQDVKDVNELMEKHPRDGRDIFARLVRYAESQK